MKILYVSDLDGTLLTSEEKISRYSLNILNGLIENGVDFTYATARSLSTASKATVGLNMKGAAVVYNGALIVDPKNKRVLYSAAFSNEEKNYVLSLLREYGVSPFVYTMIDGAEKLAWQLGKETVAMGRYLYRRQADERLLPVFDYGSLNLGSVFYFNCMGDRESLYKVYEILSKDERFTCLWQKETYQSDYWFEIMRRDATKADAVQKLKIAGGYDRVICFGDSVNDIPMFRTCEEKYAVKNADQDLKELATAVIGYCEEDGVAKWLKENAVSNH